MAFTLPPLPFAYDAFASLGMSAETFEYHHDKHHNAYVVALNGLVEKNPDLQGKTLEELVLLSHGKPELTPVFNNAGQHLNHSQFWDSLSPKGGKLPGKLEAKVVEDFGSVEAFKEAFKQAGVTQFGSGWAWLEVKDGKVAISKTPNAENPLIHGATPILTVDVWEHAYYIDYRNRRPDFIKTVLANLVNWDYVEARFEKAVG